jgi:hypothetical protein
MSTWSNIYFESSHSGFGTPKEWALVYQLPWFIGTDYLDCFGWEILNRRSNIEESEKQGYPICPSNLSATVKAKWDGSHYRFILEPSEYLVGVDLLNSLFANYNSQFKQFDEHFIQVGVSLVKIFQENTSSLRIIHLVS